VSADTKDRVFGTGVFRRNRALEDNRAAAAPPRRRQNRLSGTTSYDGFPGERARVSRTLLLP